MRIKRILLVLSLMLLLTANVVYATNYYLETTSNIEPYGYGADWSCSLSAVQHSSGAYTDVRGVKQRATVYRNGIKIVDTSKYDESNLYSVSLSGSEISVAAELKWHKADGIA